MLFALGGKRHGAGTGTASLNPLDWLFDALVDLLPERLWRGLFAVVGMVLIGVGLREGGVIL